jgi:feruloyl esterase
MVDVSFQVLGNYLATLRSPGADVPPALIAQIDPFVKASCDAVDGVRDGLIQNPAACNFRPARDLPRCANDQPGANCFTREQIETISTLVTAVTDENGKVIQPGFAVGEILPFFRGTRPADINARVPWDDNSPPEASLAPLGSAVLKTFAMKNDPAFDTRSIFKFAEGGRGPVTDYRVVVPSSVAKRAYSELRMGIGSDPRQAAKLIASNRKLLIWHNASDEKLTPFMSVNYYKQLAAMYGGYDKLQRNIRLFMVPGTSHCSIGAVGPGNFDALTALENWVELGIGPDGLVASLYDRVSPVIDRNKTPLRTMPLCKFPEMARYSGNGDINVAANWTCPPSDKRMLEVGESGRQAGVLH